MKPESRSQTPQTPSWCTERQAQVAELVRANGSAKVDELAQLFGVSTQTIRKDINDMCERGLLRRFHGGVEMATVNADHYELRRILNLTAKQRIGQQAAELVPDNATLAVSIGTTPEMVVAALAQRKDLRIYSNNLHLAISAHRFDGLTVTIPGGTLRESEADIVGPSAVAFFDSYKFDIGLFGVAAVDQDGGLLDLSEEDVHSRDAIHRNASERILVLDATKFGRKAHVRSGCITDVEHVICDVRPPEAICARLAAAEVNLVICDEAAE
ncbi:MAG: DeoR/GlpR family DNA-binding transcription regulator [Rhodobacteraceae bacterium]|nr:DeoR/GlpR family DNA-binding transcription regulator [Paracoccaceae bacterium]